MTKTKTKKKLTKQDQDEDKASSLNNISAKNQQKDNDQHAKHQPGLSFADPISEEPLKVNRPSDNDSA